MDLAEAIDIFRAGVPDAQDADDEHFEVDDVASLEREGEGEREREEERDTEREKEREGENCWAPWGFLVLGISG